MRALPLLVLFLAVVGCRQPDPPPITGPWSDSFDRKEIGPEYYATADVYAIREGNLTVANAYNHPLWLRKKLPRDAAIELDLWSNSPAGDIKVEAWGDGRSYAHDKGAYTSTGYVFVMGGWNNSKNILAKGNEHGSEVVERRLPRVELGRKVHWKIVRKGTRVDWYVDDMTTPFLSLDDPAPLEGKGHDYFAFNDWESELHFDNLTITPL
jgi:hypothetical protein